MPEILQLPQYDSENEEARKLYLRNMRKLYAYTLTYDGQIATINNLPKREEQPLSYKLSLALNMAQTITSLPSLFYKYLKFNVFKRPFKKFDDYFFFKHAPFPNPSLRKHFLEDQYLGYQRVAGMNPVVIEGVSATNPIPETMKLESKMLNMSEQEFQQALTEKRFYMTNYSMLKPLMDNPGEVDGLRKYVTPAIAIYLLKPDGLLQAVAVQFDVTRNTDYDNPIVTPNDERWRSARTFIQAADGTHHELWTHATRIHYVMESIILASWSQLGKNHPLLALLEPHLKITLSINVNPLFEPAPDGSIPTFGKMFACDNPSLVAFMGEGMNKFSFTEYELPRDIERRQVDNPELNYPYRDDGMLWWDEMQRFAKEILAVYYKNDQDVVEDYELQSWAAALGGKKECNNFGLTDFPTSFSTVEQLAKIVGQIIFIATAHHSSIHYAQYECAGYAPNMPFSSYEPPLTEPSDYQSEKGLVKFFPRWSMAMEQALIFFLTNFRVNSVGDYSTQSSSFNEQAKAAIAAHQKRIAAIGEEIDRRNQARKFPYFYMHPKNVPNSVTV